MPKELTPEEVYDNLITLGLYEEANRDKDEIKKVLVMTAEDYLFAKSLRTAENPSWRIIFNAHYDILRELCDQLMRFKRQKTSNHQGVFAFVVLNFKELELDWLLLERLRTARNASKYQAVGVSKEMWKSVEIQFDLYIPALQKEIKEKLKDAG